MCRTFEYVFVGHFVFVLQHFKRHVKLGHVVQFEQLDTLEILKRNIKIRVNSYACELSRLRRKSQLTDK